MYATIHSMTNVSAVVDWSRPSNPNGVIEGYRLYFLHGNFTDVKTIKSRDPRVDYILTNLGKKITLKCKSFPNMFIFRTLNYILCLD